MRSNLKKNTVINEDNATANDYKMLRSSPPEVFLGKVVLKIYCKYGGEHSYWSVISIKLQIAFRHECSINLLHILRTPFYENIYEGLLLIGDLLNFFYSNAVKHWKIQEFKDTNFLAGSIFYPAVKVIMKFHLTRVPTIRNKFIHKFSVFQE